MIWALTLECRDKRSKEKNQMIDILAVVVIVVACIAFALMFKKKKMPTLFMLLFSAAAMAQGNCDKVVADTADMLGGKIAQVEQAAGPLINQGADVHVVTVQSSKGNLDFVENDIEKMCPSWRNPQGVRKNNLLALVVSKDRKLGIYYGSSWHNALDNHWNRIKTDYMVPKFRDGDYAGGFIVAEEQLTKRLAAAKDESLKPVVAQNSVVNQATDFSGLWRFLTWLLVFGLVGGTVWIIIYATRKRRQDQLAVAKAQQTAQLARNLAVQDIGRLEKDIEIEEATGGKVNQVAKDRLDMASQSYSRLGNAVTTSPDTDGLAVSDYEVMTEQYTSISRDVNAARRVMSGVSVNENKDKEPSRASEQSTKSATSKPSNHSHSSHHSNKSTSTGFVTPQPQPPIYTPPSVSYPVFEPNPSVVIIDNSSHEYEHTHRHERDDYVAPTSSSSSYDSGGGGSSSWSSSDDSSSISFDSGGSSSFDSGSSDSGGGGSDSF